MLEKNTIYNMDWLEGIKQLEDKSIDYAFTSPPYNRKRNDKYALYDDTMKDYYAFLESTIENMRRVVRKHIFFNIQTNCYNRQDVYRLIGKYADQIQNVIVWEKTNPMPASGYNVTNAFEYFLIIGDTPLKATSTYTKNHITTSVNSAGTSKIHKAIMNYKVAEWFFDNFIPKGSSVIDPFMGFGTTAVASIKHDCDYIGFDVCQEYCAEAEKRVQHALQEKYQLV